MDCLEQKVLEEKKKFESCGHLFIKLKEGFWNDTEDGYFFGAIPCKVRCLNCGLTNEHIPTEQNYYKKYDLTSKIMNPDKYCKLEANDEVYKKYYDGGWREDPDILDEMVFNLISNEVFNVDNASFLYKVAKKIKPFGTNAELFEIMKELHEMEKREEEKNNITNINKQKVKKM